MGQMAEESLYEMPSDFELVLAMDRPLQPGQVRIFFCRDCGAITFIRYEGNELGLGDPVQHRRWHSQLEQQLRGSGTDPG